MNDSQFLNDIFGGPDLYVNTNRTNNGYPWEENYQPTPYMPSAESFYDWGLYRLPQTNAESSYFMSQESAQPVTQPMPASKGSTHSGYGHLGGGRSSPAPTSSTVGTPAPLCASYTGQPLPAIHSQYVQQPLTVLDRQVSGGALFRQESCSNGACVSNLTTLSIFLVLGLLVTYALIYASRR